jgi:superfamily II DNA or RNA helicase
MSALHTKASFWIRQGIFDDLRSFEAFEARVNGIPEEKDRGDVFEIFIEGYLATQIITQCVKHWVVGDIPLSLLERYRLPSDATGIDGIYETHDGSQVAYQVKYRQKQALTFAEVAPFLGITEQFSDRVVFTNAATLSEKAIIRTRWVSGEIFRALSPDAFSNIEAWLKIKPLPIVRAQPDPNYQVQALADIKATLAKHDRTTVVMACGTGKTLVSLWAAEQETPKTVLVLVPSLTLLQQTLREWSEQTSWANSFSYLCVCSDPTVGLKNDALITDPSEVGFRIDTDPAIVRQFLERETTDIKVVFSTYHSSKVVGDGARGLAPIDIAIFDEAHKTIGLAGSAFGYAISDQNIQIKKRLFLTATPRHIDIRHRDKEDEFRIYSMDDAAAYGPRAHTLTFGVAAQKGIICRYKVIISLIDKEMVDDFTRKRGITLVERDEVSARWMANLIALQYAIERVDARKIISFHSRVRLAQAFAANQPRGIAYHLRDYDVRHVNGGQSSGVRAEIIRSFADAEKALLTNARCLTEGIDIPAVDMVAFIDPRQSRIDIAQAVGRAMRKPRVQTTKTVGFVVVPLFAGTGEKDSLEDAIKSENFEAVVDVLNALQEHDEELVDIIREIKERKGAGESFNPKRLIEKVEVIGPRVDLDRLTTSIGIEIAEKIGSSWDEGYGRLLRYKTREGHCRVPHNYVDGAFRLGRWVIMQRTKKKQLSAERIQRLDAIGFIWDRLEDKWEEGFATLTKFKAMKGHCNVPGNYIDGEFKLGKWVIVQRTHEAKLSADRRRRLEEIGIVWRSQEFKWARAVGALKSFKDREGHCLVPRDHLEGSFNLGRWVDHNRQRESKLLSERKEQLNDLGLVWDSQVKNYDAGIIALEKFKAREIHCRVPAVHLEEKFKLGKWVQLQRQNIISLPIELRLRLDAMGFVWDAADELWKEGFSMLKIFRAREGHCRVPRDHFEQGFRLGHWVTVQRKSGRRIPEDRWQLLDNLGFVWLKHEVEWEEAYLVLCKFQEREGHCRVPRNYLEGKFNLGTWVFGQRHQKDKMFAERRKRLDQIGFVWSVK